MRVPILILLATTVVLSACNTIAGVGRDVESVGSTVAKTADGANSVPTPALLGVSADR